MTAASSAGVPAGRERLPALDLLRFVAALMVVLFHYTFRGAADHLFTSATYPEIDAITRYGSYGVNLFFVISGFVILLTVDAGGGHPGHFIASRVSRLFPAFWVAATVTFVIVLLVGASFAVGIDDYVRNLTMMPSWIRAPYVDGAYWTLEIELTFYVLIVAFLLFLQRRIRIEWLLAAWLLIVLPFAPNDLGPGRLRLGLMVEAAPYFIAGSSFYLVWRSGWTPLRAFLIAGAWAVAAILAVHNSVTDSATFATSFAPLATVAVASIGFVVFLALVLRPSWFRFGGRPAVLLGALTYPLYLVHQNIGYVVINGIDPTWGRWLAFLAAFGVALLLAYAIHRLVERRYNSRLRRWLEPRLGVFDRIAEVGAMPVPHEPQPGPQA